ncbi:hypothetical protein [Halovenus salina]|uniref:Uncharacterized protein n=1 Tax=Halovenus salina TaxID=1510225 RepID=A0ABD5W2S4_9EURY
MARHSSTLSTNHSTAKKTLTAAQTRRVDLDRATCPTAEGEHGDGWRLRVQTARALGYTPSEIHRHDLALFGEELPCQCDGDCHYTLGWEPISDPGTQLDVLVGAPSHAFVESARSYFDQKGDGDIVTTPRAVVIDEFIDDEYVTEYGERYMDHATWLAECLAGVNSREELLTADGLPEAWIDLWLEGDGDEFTAAADTQELLRAGEAVADARHRAEEFLEELKDIDTRCNLASVRDQLQEFVDPGGIGDMASLKRTRKSVGHAHGKLTQAADAAYAHGESGAGELYSLATALEDVLNDLDTADALAGDLTDLENRVRDCAAGLPVGGDLRSLLDDASDVIAGDDDRTGLLTAAVNALEGGRDGCRELSMYAEDGYAHPNAWALLAGAIADAEDGGVSEVTAQQFSFDNSEGGVFKRLSVNDATIAADKNHHGALVQDAPTFASGESACPVVALDATGRPRLWQLALGRTTQRRDVHESDAERRGFLRDVMNLRVVQTSQSALPYFSDPSGRNFGEDLELVETAAEEFTGHRTQCLDTKKPAVISSKKVLRYLDDELGENAGELVNYMDMKGSDALAEHQVGVILGSPHFGDQHPEKWAVLAGEDAGRGEERGMNLDYGSDIANDYLKHMREDHVMQAILRSGRNEDPTLVFAHTAALRDDLPVDDSGVVLSAHSKGALAVAEAAKSTAVSHSPHRTSPGTLQGVPTRLASARSRTSSPSSPSKGIWTEFARAVQGSPTSTMLKRTLGGRRLNSKPQKCKNPVAAWG